jgi:hypothetical protein
VALIKGWPIAWPDGSWRPAREEVEMAGLVVITPGEHGDALLEAFTVERHWFGDTCVESVQVAKEIAAEEWGIAPGEWESVAVTTDDPVAFAVDAARSRIIGI